MNLISLISFGVTPVVPSLTFTVNFRIAFDKKHNDIMCDVLENVADEYQLFIDVLSIVSS